MLKKANKLVFPVITVEVTEFFLEGSGTEPNLSGLQTGKRMKER